MYNVIYLILCWVALSLVASTLEFHANRSNVDIDGLYELQNIYENNQNFVLSEKEYLVNKAKDIKSLERKLLKYANNKEALLYDVYLNNSKNFAKYAAASYCSDENVRTWNCKYHCGETTKVLTIFEDTETGTKGYLATNKEKRIVILSFRGSSNMKNWIQNIKILMEEYKSNNQKENNSEKITIHSGFLEAAKLLHQKYSLYLSNVFRSNEYKDYRLILTGHSLGGAIAAVSTMLINTINNINWNILELYTYGQPRTGNKGFSDFLLKNNLKSVRTVNENDIVPSVPFALLGYYHNGRELWSKSNNSYVLCSKNVSEDPICSSTLFERSFLAHSYVWDTNFSLIC